MLEDVVAGTATAQLAGAQYAEEWDLDGLLVNLRAVYECKLKVRDLKEAGESIDDVNELVVEDAFRQYDELEKVLGSEQTRNVERAVMLEVIDARWKDHLLDMDYLQEGIHLRALGQRDPLVEYKGEGFELFQDMLETVKKSVVTMLMKNRPEDLAFFTAITLEQPLQAFNYSSGDELVYQTDYAAVAEAYGQQGPPPEPVGVTAGAGKQRFQEAQQAGGVAVKQRVVEQKIGRNDPCWCGSGKKYKRCHEVKERRAGLR
jgi:preprotein translocase subunit SecA